MKKKLPYLLLLITLSVNAQQFPQYTQFIFNKIGYNPAASGTAVNANFELIFGGRTQWIGLSGNPKSQFVSFNYNFVPQRSYHRWHNVGMYVDQDQNGAFTHNDMWLSYTYHMLIDRKMILSAGLFAGIKQFRASLKGLDTGDPAVQRSSASVIAYPDIVPGVRLTGKKFFADLSLQQVTMFSKKGIGGAIGAPSKLFPHYNISAGKKGSFNDYNVLLLAVNFRGSFVGKPSIELNVMNYYDKKFAFGASVRGRNFMSAIIQFRLVRTLSVGLAYDFSINKMMRSSPSTGEIMMSVSPVFGGEKADKADHRIVDQCTF